MKIGITIVATNSYFVLGIRFIKRFMQFYKGKGEISFYMFTDKDPKDYLPDSINYVYIHTEHKNWVDGTNSKFTNILGISELAKNEDYLYQFDADTNVSKPFGDWFLGDLVGGRHYADHIYETKPFERNPISCACVPFEDKTPAMYYYGAFFGGKRVKVRCFCETLRAWQEADQHKGFEPVWNDESYINKYFHLWPPKVIMCEDFPFDVSDKGGIGETRNPNLDVRKIESDLMLNREKNVNIVNGYVVLLD